MEPPLKTLLFAENNKKMYDFERFCTFLYVFVLWFYVILYNVKRYRPQPLQPCRGFLLQKIIYSKGKDNCLNLVSIVERYTIQSIYVRISPHIIPNPQPRQRGYTIHQNGIRRAKLCAVGMPTHVHIVSKIR